MNEELETDDDLWLINEEDDERDEDDEHDTEFVRQLFKVMKETK